MCLRTAYRPIEGGDLVGAGEEAGWAAAFAHGGLAGVGEPARCLPNLALEIAGVEFGTPHHLVDPPQVADAEGARLEGGGEGGFLKGRTQCFEGIVEDLGVVERQRHSAGKHVRDG